MNKKENVDKKNESNKKTTETINSEFQPSNEFTKSKSPEKPDKKKK